MRRQHLDLPWPGVRAGLAAFGVAGETSRLEPAMRRLHQSRAARALAIGLLEDEGVSAGTIGKGPVGQPLWPIGVVGSLAHTEGYAAAAVARDAACRALGIDVETAEPLPADAADLVLRPEEAGWVRGAQARAPDAGKLVFCAKECVHKAVHPLSGCWLDFQEVRIEIAPDHASFVPVPLSAAARSAFGSLRSEGRFLRRDGVLLAVLALF